MNLIERQFDDTKIKYFFIDNGTEYVNSNGRYFFHEKGIVHNTIPAHTHEYNGMAERFNRTISTMVQMLLLHGNLHGHLQEEKQLDKRLWAEASRTAVVEAPTTVAHLIWDVHKSHGGNRYCIDAAVCAGESKRRKGRKGRIGGIASGRGGVV